VPREIRVVAAFWRKLAVTFFGRRFFICDKIRLIRILAVILAQPDLFS